MSSHDLAYTEPEKIKSIDAEFLSGRRFPYQEDISLVEDVDLLEATPGEDINWLEDITLLEEDGVEAVVLRTRTPELLGDVEAEEALLAGLLPDVAVDGLDLEHLLGTRLQGPLDELVDRAAEGLVVGAVDVAGHAATSK